ncbi:MAG: hypothetical protein NT031_11065 [Planctomycetota bacterium]|nr:hypothetical protein [Planctomycetota bacterium]
MFPRAPAEVLPATDGFFQRPGFTIASFTYRHHGDSRAGLGPQLQAIRLDGRAAILFSPEDLTTGLLGTHSFAIDGYSPQTAWEIMRNVVLSTAAEKPVPESQPKDSRKARR